VVKIDISEFRNVAFALALTLALPAYGIDTIYLGGTILTMDGDTPAYAEAVSVEDGKIVFVGSESEALNRRTESTTLKDLDGKTMLPGFIDPHSHFMGGLNLSNQVNVASPPVGTATDIPSVIANIKAFQEKARIAEGDWIVGWGYDQDGLAEGRHITREDLDSHFPDHKILLIHVSHHGAVLNSLALEHAGINQDTETPPGGIINRLPGSNAPAGLLMETAFFPIFDTLPQPTRGEMFDMLKEAQLLYTREGYTHAQDSATALRDVDFLLWAARQGRLFIDIALLPLFNEAPKLVNNPEYRFGEYTQRLKLQGIKFLQDGSPQGKTAFFTTPYLTGGPGGQEDWRGETTLPREEFLEAVKDVFDAGIQVFIHANGDGAIDQAIEAVDHAGITAADNRRTVVIHSQFQRPDHLDRYVELGMTPTYFTNHTFFWGDVHVENLGPEIAAFISPIRAAKEKGLVFSNHSDFIVTPLDPFFILWTAMARESRNGVIIGADQRVDAYTALQGLTTGPAWQIFEEDRKGMIREGLLADFVILSNDPVKSDVNSIRDIKVLETIKEDKTVFRAD
jgi:predicted amidohydrolase YtcJ